MGREEPRRYACINRASYIAKFLLDALQSSAPLRPDFEVSAAPDIEIIHQIVERCRRRAQVSRPRPDSSTPETEVGGLSFRAALDELPGLNDLSIFGVSCKVRLIVIFIVTQDSSFADRARARSGLATPE